jgi:hypothetical protein
MAKDPKDETDLFGLRWFAKRIAEMRWWQDTSTPDEQAELDIRSEVPRDQDQQSTTGDANPEAPVARPQSSVQCPTLRPRQGEVPN